MIPLHPTVLVIVDSPRSELFPNEAVRKNQVSTIRSCSPETGEQRKPSSIKGRERTSSLGSFFEEEGAAAQCATAPSGSGAGPCPDSVSTELDGTISPSHDRYLVCLCNPSTASGPPSATSIVALSLSAHCSFRLIPPLRCFPHCGRSAPSPLTREANKNPIPRQATCRETELFFSHNLVDIAGVQGDSVPLPGLRGRAHHLA